MSADLLREAAGRLRSDANACTTEVPWHTTEDLSTFDREDAEYIARMKPAVALAVADWLDTQAARWDQVYADTQRPSAGVDQPPAIHYGDTFGAANTANHHTRHALAVARVYLGSPS